MEEKKEASILDLWADCLAKTISLTSPRDACRYAAISKEFKSVADSDAVWERFLPPDYEEITARAVSPVVFDSKKKLYHLLSESRILLDDGYLSFMLDKWSGKKCYMLGSRNIDWGDESQSWIRQAIPESRFPEVAILRDINWLHIKAKIATAMLSRKSRYKACLVFKSSWGLEAPPRSMVSFSETGIEASNVCRQIPRQVPDLDIQRKDGWKEVELGEFYCDEEDDGGEVVMTFKGVWIIQYSKPGLIVEGFELRPI